MKISTHKERDRDTEKTIHEIYVQQLEQMRQNCFAYLGIELLLAVTWKSREIRFW